MKSQEQSEKRKKVSILLRIVPLFALLVITLSACTTPSVTLVASTDDSIQMKFVKGPDDALPENTEGRVVVYSDDRNEGISIPVAAVFFPKNGKDAPTIMNPSELTMEEMGVMPFGHFRTKYHTVFSDPGLVETEQLVLDNGSGAEAVVRYLVIEPSYGLDYNGATVRATFFFWGHKKIWVAEILRPQYGDSDADIASEGVGFIAQGNDVAVASGGPGGSGSAGGFDPGEVDPGDSSDDGGAGGGGGDTGGGDGGGDTGGGGPGNGNGNGDNTGNGGGNNGGGSGPGSGNGGTNNGQGGGAGNGGGGGGNGGGGGGD